MSLGFQWSGSRDIEEMLPSIEEFSYRTRKESLRRFQEEVFDLLIIGGGITGAAVARDATSRGLKVALVEKKDFAWGTSSRSSKLIHGGLRYLQNLELGLVFEALSERALLLKTVPHMVRPLPFFLPVYKNDPNGRAILTMGLWLYDLLALFRTPGFHRGLSRRKILKEIPFLDQKGLLGGFRYFDASMWDDVLAIETLRAAKEGGAAVANYVEAKEPIWKGDQIIGFRVQDLATGSAKTIDLKARRTVVCAGPWTDQIGKKLSANWTPWLEPSKGVHLIFDLKRIPIPGALVMSHPKDGRISFVIPRPDYGAGVVIVGTTDGPVDRDPEKAEVTSEDVEYLLDLLNRYFPDLHLSTTDILSAYVGVRPLMGGPGSLAGSEGQGRGNESSVTLQKVSREHHIGSGPGGTVIVAGGKYTTHRKMAEEIVDFTLKSWKKDTHHGGQSELPLEVRRSNTRSPVNAHATFEAVAGCRREAERRGLKIPEALLARYGAEALAVMRIQKETFQRKVPDNRGDPSGFPLLAAQLRHSIRTEMILHLEDFYLRRVPLYSSRKDHGMPWAAELAEVWADEMGYDQTQVVAELESLREELRRRSAWEVSNKLSSV